MRSLTSLTLSFFLLFSFSATAEEHSKSKIAFSLPVISTADDKWDTMSYDHQNTFENVNSISSSIATRLHYALDLDKTGPFQRVLYLATVGQVHYRVLWATSVLGHEYAHFQAAHHDGFTNHSFYDYDTKETFSTADAWKRAFLHQDVGGPAYSYVPQGGEVTSNPEHDIERSLAGMNWQTQVSADMAKKWYWDNEETPFSAAGYFINRIYATQYVYNEMEDNYDSISTDPQKYFTHMSENYGIKDPDSKILTTMVLAHFASPLLYSFSSGGARYIFNGDLSAKPLTYPIFKGRLGLDTPTYFNYDNFSVAPTLYWTADTPQTFNLDTLNLGFSYETSVIGNERTENYIFGRIIKDKFTAEAGTTLVSKGNYTDVKISYEVTPVFAISGRYISTDDVSLRGCRQAQGNKTLFWLAADIQF
jgi:hypothetical protein